MKVKITRQQNAQYYKVNIGDIVQIPMYDYLCSVVASQIGNASLQACKAQAVASRTLAYIYDSKDKPISDSSSVAQAFRSSRINTIYHHAYEAVKQTSGQILHYNGQLINSCPYCHSNGGKTVSSKERWGGQRQWLIAQKDPWDKGTKSGHGVGMSQTGAIYAAQHGIDYRHILSFYYPNTTIQKEGGDDMAIEVNQLIEIFKKALDQKWGYIYGAMGQTWTSAKQNAATRQQTVKWGKKWVGKTVVDCSGLFSYAFKKLGGYMYHGSNTMFKKYCTATGTLINGQRKDNQCLLPGTAVFKYNEKEGYHHVGLYVGDNTVIEAKGTYYGVVSSKLNEWTHWGQLKGVNYTKQQPSNDKQYAVVIGNGKLNLRRQPTRDSSRITQIPQGTKIEVLKQASTNPQWYFVQYGSTQGYVDGTFIKLI